MQKTMDSSGSLAVYKTAQQHPILHHKLQAMWVGEVRQAASATQLAYATMERHMKERLQHIEFRPYTGLKHVDASTTEERAQNRVASRKTQANAAEIARNVVWWRFENSRKDFFQNLLYTLKRKLGLERAAKR